jgi:valyl-tRNA synthetase
LDKYGKKMSKSRPETIVDPQDIIDNFGADTLRFTLATGTTLGQDQRFQMEKVEGSRNFTNKIWNAARFVLMHEETDQAGDLVDNLQASLVKSFMVGESDTLPDEWLSLPDRWILTRSQKVTAEVTQFLEQYDLGAAASLLYEFLWNEYCDWYIEFSKPRLYQKENDLERRATQAVLTRILRQTMELLHPFMPFLTEEIWQALPSQGESIMIAKWPEASEKLVFDRAENEMGLIIEMVRAIRNIRSENNVAPGKKITAIFACPADKQEILERNMEYLANLAGLESVQFMDENAPKPEKAVSAVAGGVTLFMPMAGLVDVAKERERFTKELNQLEAEITKLATRIENPAFSRKAPPEIVAKERAKLEGFKEKAQKIKERLQDLT